jgi:hypothetical protein
MVRANRGGRVRTRFGYAAAALAAAAACAQGAADPENGQTGSLDLDECYEDSECVPNLELWRNPRYEAELLSARCGARGTFSSAPVLGGLPTCICNARVTEWLPTRERPASMRLSTLPLSPQTYEYDLPLSGPEAYDDLRFPTCGLSDRPDACDYCEQDFPGCFLGEPAEHCEAICEDFLARERRVRQAPHMASVRFAKCELGVPNRCVAIVELDGQCFDVFGPYAQTDEAVDCAASDEELLRPEERHNQPFSADSLCAERPALPCQTAVDCPGGLACNGSLCGLCDADRVCGSSSGSGAGVLSRSDCAEILAGYQCAGDEVCVGGTCVRRSQADCVDASIDCPELSEALAHVRCELSGIDRTRVRGNEETWSRCPVCKNPAATMVEQCFEPQ